MPGPSFRDKKGKGTGLKYPKGGVKKSGKAKTTTRPSKAYAPSPTKVSRAQKSISRERKRVGKYGRGKTRELHKAGVFGLSRGRKKRALTYLGLREPKNKPEKRLANRGEKIQRTLDITPREGADILLEYEGVRPKAAREARLDQLAKQKPKGKLGRAYVKKEVKRLKGKPREEVAQARRQYQHQAERQAKKQAKKEAVRELREPGRQSAGGLANEDVEVTYGRVKSGRHTGRLKGVPRVSKQRAQARQGQRAAPATKPTAKQKYAKVRVPGSGGKKLPIDEPIHPTFGNEAKEVAEAAAIVAPIPLTKIGMAARLAARGTKAARAASKISAGVKGSRAAKATRAVKSAPKKIPKPKRTPKDVRAQVRANVKASKAVRKARAKGAPKRGPKRVAVAREAQRKRIPGVSRRPKEAAKLRNIGRAGALPVTHPAVLKNAAKASGKSWAGVNYGPDVATGHARALEEDPEKVLETTARMLPGLVTAPIGLVANLGLSGYRGVASGLGLEDYSGAEISDPIEGEARAQLEFLERFVDTMTSGDPDRIAEAVKNEYGLLAPIMTGTIGARTLREPYRSLRTRLRLAAEERPGVGAARLLHRKTDTPGRIGREEPLPVTRMAQKRQARKRTAIAGARAEREWQVEAHAAGQPIIDAMRRVQGDRKAKADPGDVLKVVLEEGIPKGDAGLAYVRELRQNYKRHEDIGPDDIAGRDALDYILAHPDLLKDEKFWDATNAYSRQVLDVGTSERARLLKVARSNGILTPEERYPASVAGMMRKPAKAFQDAKKTMRTEARVDRKAGRDEMADAKLAAVKESMDARDAAYKAEVDAVIEAKGLRQPAWTHDADLLREPGVEATPGFVRGSKKVHGTKGKLREEGRAAHAFEGLIQGSVVAPRVRQAAHRFTRNFIESEKIPVRVGDKTRYLVTSKEYLKAVRDGTISPKDTVILPANQFKQAALDPDALGSAMRDLFEGKITQEKFAKNVETIAGELVGRSKHKGSKYVVVDREAARQFLSTLETSPLKALATAQRGASRAILGYSPSWMLLQPIAESAQALAAVSPHHMAQGLRGYHKLPERERIAFDSLIGETRGLGLIGKNPQLALKGNGQGLFHSAHKAINRTPVGRAIYNVFSGEGARKIDGWKGGRIRRAVAAGHLHREYNGFLSGLENMMRRSRDLSKKSDAELQAYFAKNKRAADQLESYLDDVMGNWTALTYREKYAAPFIIFYPFVRMSLKWALWSFPKRHPIKASAMAWLAQQNASQLQMLLGGDPSFFSQWAQVPLYGGKEGKASSLIDLARIAPGSNAFIEAFGDSSRGFLTTIGRTLNPVLGAALAARAGEDPMSGRSLVEKGETVSDETMGRIFLAQMLSLPAPARALLTATETKEKIIGKPETPTSRLFEAVQGQTDLDRVLRSNLMPLKPKLLRGQARAAEIGRLIEQKYDKPQFEENLKAIESLGPKKDRPAVRSKRRDLARAVVAEQKLNAYYDEYGLRDDSVPDAAIDKAGRLTGERQFSIPYDEMAPSTRWLIKKYGGRPFLRKYPLPPRRK